jgi:tRNA threonylcarbamoyl adenosine modification protein YeaZ
MKGHSRIILAIEAAIGGGSISLQRDGIEIANWIGATGQAKAENLLVDIDNILKGNDLNVSDVDMIAVAAGPGSFTGIRIGIATGLGLTTGLGIDLASESALTATAKLLSPPGHSVVAVPTGRDAICYQSFDRTNGLVTEAYAPATESFTDFEGRLSTYIHSTFILHPDIFEKVGGASNAVECDRNIAFSVGRACDVSPVPRVDPMFISKSF